MIPFCESFLKLGLKSLSLETVVRAKEPVLQIVYFENQDVLLVLQLFDLLSRVGERLPPETFGPSLKVGRSVRGRLGFRRTLFFPSRREQQQGEQGA